MNINLDFFKFYSDPIELNDVDDPILLYCYYGSLSIIDKRDIPLDNRIDKDSIKFLYKSDLLDSLYHGPTILYPFLDWDSLNLDIACDQLCNLQKFKNGSYTSATIIIKLSHGENGYTIDYYINQKIIQDFCLNRRNYKINILMTFFEKLQLKSIHTKCQESMDLILKNVSKISKDELELELDNLCNIKLYDYQKDDIKWLKMIQERIDTNKNIISYEYPAYLKLELKDEEGNISDNQIYYCNYNFRKDIGQIHKSNFRYYGGNLISEMGLGKSIIMLCYLLEKDNSSPFICDTQASMCNYFYKRGKSKGESCSRKSLDKNIYCKEHTDTPFIDKMIITYKNLDLLKIDDFIEKKLFKTNASLILCPSHLCDQWAREYYSKFKKQRRVLLIVTFDQYTNLTFGDILFADLIIMSYNFLTNPNYININTPNKQFKGSDLGPEELLKSKDYNCFSNFKFKSIVLDEFHEIIKMPKYNYLEQVIESFHSDYIWNISGTPFANGLDGFFHGTKYICRDTFSTNINRHSTLTHYVDEGINENLINAFKFLYRRNTKESIVSEYTGNMINENLQLLKFTDQERNIYDSYLMGNEEKNYQFLIKLCCDPEINAETQGLIKNCKTFDEIQTVLLEHNKKKLDNHSDVISELENTIEFLIDQVEKSSGDLQNDYEASLTISKRNLTNENKAYKDVKRIYDYLKNVIDNLKNTETCPICLDDITEIAVTKCGHKFCWGCIDEFIKVFKTTKCPKCNIPINIDDIFRLKELDIDNTYTTDESIEGLVNKVKSTKLGNVIYYIKKMLSENDKCIIFSQWDPLLHKLGNYLEEFDCKIVYCDNSVYQRKKAISSFSSDRKNSPNIIMLSSKNAASGINLTAANKIILLEPVYGTQEYRQAIENQAIGRADRIGQERPIEVIRFIIQDTIEEQIMNQNQNKN